jgi:8-oxo-dGTP pyrophosphatase MutT (NUDIX family)
VKREIKEETNLDVKEIMYLNWIFKYIDKTLECTEYAYISFVGSAEITLDETENIDYLWCDLDEFIKRIRWFGDLEVLKKVLEFGIKRKIFFNIEQIEK